MLSDWTFPTLAVVFITWGLGFVGVAAWSIHKEYKARQAQKTEALVTPEEIGGLNETGGMVETDTNSSTTESPDK